MRCGQITRTAQFEYQWNAIVLSIDGDTPCNTNKVLDGFLKKYVPLGDTIWTDPGNNKKRLYLAIGSRIYQLDTSQAKESSGKIRVSLISIQESAALQNGQRAVELQLAFPGIAGQSLTQGQA